MSRKRYTLQQIIEAARWAWSSSGDDEPDVYFDGAVFWCTPAGEARVAAVTDVLPQEGWWHAKDCFCALCRPSRR